MLRTITDTCTGPYSYSEDIQRYKLILVFNTIVWGKIVDIFDFTVSESTSLFYLAQQLQFLLGKLCGFQEAASFSSCMVKRMTQSESTGIFNFSGHTVIGTDMDMKSMLIQSGWISGDFLCMLEWRNCLFHVICKRQSIWPWKPWKLILRPWRKLTIGWSCYVR